MSKKKAELEVNRVMRNEVLFLGIVALLCGIGPMTLPEMAGAGFVIGVIIMYFGYLIKGLLCDC